MEPLDKLKRELSLQRSDMTEFLARGGPADYPAYCKAVGAIQTLDLVLSMLDDITNKLIED